jgi:hypothetical protein
MPSSILCNALGSAFVPDNPHFPGHYPTSSGARTGLFVAEWSKLFVAVPHRGVQRAEVLVYQMK